MGPNGRPEVSYDIDNIGAGARRARKNVAGRVGRVLVDRPAEVPLVPMGEYGQTRAYRKDLVDVLPGCFTTSYGVWRV